MWYLIQLTFFFFIGHILSPQRYTVTTSSSFPSGSCSSHPGQDLQIPWEQFSFHDKTLRGSNSGYELHTRRAAIALVEERMSCSSPAILSLVMMARMLVQATQEFLAKSLVVGLLHSCGISLISTDFLNVHSGYFTRNSAIIFSLLHIKIRFGTFGKFLPTDTKSRPGLVRLFSGS